MHLFGLTGGIASGKSTVGARLRRRGVPVIDADELAREVVAPGSDGLREVVDAFGPGILESEGVLDRKTLARLVFTDAAVRRKLNAITHPRIAGRLLEQAADLAAGDTPLACYEAALIVENGVADAFRPLVVCACPEEVQASRLRARDATMSLDEALARIRSQTLLAAKIAVADHVIDTSGSREVSAQRTDDVLRMVCDRLGVDPRRYGLL